MEKDAPFHNSSDSNRVRRRSLFLLDTFSRRRVNLLMGFLAFHGRYIKYASCPGYHLSSAIMDFHTPLPSSVPSSSSSSSRYVTHDLLRMLYHPQSRMTT